MSNQMTDAPDDSTLTVDEEREIYKRLISDIESEILTCTPGSAAWLFYMAWRENTYNVLNQMRDD